MVQRRQHSGFTLESCGSFSIVRKDFGKKLDSNTAAQLRVGGLIHVSHAARSQVAGDFVVCQFGADHDVRRTAGEFYQISPKQLTHLRFALERLRGSQLTYNPDAGEVRF